MENIDEKDLILTAYRGDKKTQTININLKAHTYGNELYRISLMLLDKIIDMANDNPTEEDIKKFFVQMSDDYIEFYRRK
ncbi:MAG: hypothetical protein MSS80_08045 [Mollicutes bacterium]|nr:hypothetical protein [Mollicutes bacterium]